MFTKSNVTMLRLISSFIFVILPVFLFCQSLISMSPSTADAGQTLDLIITGDKTHFGQGAETNINFTFSGFNQGSVLTSTNSITVTSDTTLIANITVPSNTYTGDYYASYFNTIDGYLNALFSLHVNGTPAPSYFALSPDTLNAGQTLDVTLNGLNTHFNHGSGTTVTFTPQYNITTSDSIIVNSVNVTDSSQLIINITRPPPIYSGDYNINTYNQIDGNMSMTGLHIYGVTLPPSLYGISNNPLNAGQTLDFTITGKGTHFDQGDSISVGFDFVYNLGNVPAIVNSITVISATVLTANITIPSNTLTGVYNLFVTDSIDGVLSYGGIFVYGIQPPTLTSISPNIGNAGETLDVILTGANTHFDQSTINTIEFGFNQSTGISIVNSINVTSPTTLIINITIPQNINFGFYDVNLNNNIDGDLILTNGFQVNTLLQLNGYVISNNASQDGICDGNASTIISGGAAPYDYLYSNGSGSSNISNLCQGLYSVKVTDAFGDSLSIPFIIASPNNIFSNSTFQDSTIIDSVYNAAISNCTINYSAIDSIYISNYSILQSNLMNVTWIVISGNTTETINEVYSVDSISGVYTLILQLYCPNKSQGELLKAYDQIYINKDLSEIAENQINLISISPNPFENMISISLGNSETTEIILTDITGKIFLNKKYKQSVVELDLSELKLGQYFLSIKNDSFITTRKIIK